MKVLAGDFPKDIQAWALADRFVIGEKRKGEPLLYVDIESIDLEEETKKGCVVAIRFLDGRRMLALMSDDEFLQARAGLFDAAGEIENRRAEAVARTKRVKLTLAAQAAREKKTKQFVAVIAIAIVAFVVFKPKVKPSQNTHSVAEPQAAKDPRPAAEPIAAEQPPAKSVGVIADGVVGKLTRSQYPKAYKKWGQKGFDRINGLAPKAAQLIVESGTCDSLEVLGLSDVRSKPPKSIVFFADCANGKRFYVTEADIKSQKGIVSKNDQTARYSDGLVVGQCTDAVRSSLQFPSSFDSKFGGTTVYRAPTGNVVVNIDFDAKNGFGNVLPYRGRCVFDDQGMSPPEISPR